MSNLVEVDVDSRGRVSLGKMRGEVKRYQVRALEDGEIILTPVVSVSARELAMLPNPAMSRRLRSAIRPAAAGKVTRYEPGHFTESDDDESD